MRLTTFRIFILLKSFELLLLNGSFALFVYLKRGRLDFDAELLRFLILTSISWLLVYYYRRETYDAGVIHKFRFHTRRYLYFIGVYSFILLLIQSPFESRFILLGSLGLFYVLNLLLNKVLLYLILIRNRDGKYLKKSLIIGFGRTGQKLASIISEKPELGYGVVGFLDDFQTEVDRPELILGTCKDFERIIRGSSIREIFLAIPITQKEKIKHILSIADHNGIRVRLIPDYYHHFQETYRYGRIGDLPIIRIREIPLDNVLNKFAKRTFDIAFSLLALIVLAPILFLVGVMIRIDSRGPIFYTPFRLGENGERFKCFKFRTMTADSSVSLNPTLSTVQDDPRITRIGRFLRKWSIDELPQFLNVLVGQMSVVGPRPHRLSLNKDLQEEVNGYMVRHYVKPGITGWAQVNGWRGPTETHEQKMQRTKHDIWYLKNWTFFLDVRIIIETLVGRNTKRNTF